MANSKINNSIYEEYGKRWYTAQDDPVALLRAENKLKAPWIMERIKREGLVKPEILDLGCGAGFLSNELARHGFSVTGMDLSPDSLRVADAFDETKSVHYEVGDAYELPYPSESFDVVTAMDFLEHVEDPDIVIHEVSRVLKPGGLFFFHTFNRNFLSWLVVIKLVEWLIPKTPKNMHILSLFIKPDELKELCNTAGMGVQEMTGMKPVLRSIPMTQIFSGRVPETMRFELTPHLLLSYMGYAKRRGDLLKEQDNFL